MTCEHCLIEVEEDVPPELTTDPYALSTEELAEYRRESGRHARDRREYFRSRIVTALKPIPVEHQCPGFPLWNPTAELLEPLVCLLPDVEECTLGGGCVV